MSDALPRMVAELRAALPPEWRSAVDHLGPVGVVILHARIPDKEKQDG